MPVRPPRGEIPGAKTVKLSSFARFHRGVCVGSVEIGLDVTRLDFAHFWTFVAFKIAKGNLRGIYRCRIGA